MKELNPNASAFLKQLIIELVDVIRDGATDDTIIVFDTKSMTDDEYGIKHLVLSFCCSLPADAKEYRSVFNKKMNAYKKEKSISFSNNSFINELFRVAERLVAQGKSSLMLVGHGVSGLRPQTRERLIVGQPPRFPFNHQSNGMPSFGTSRSESWPAVGTPLTAEEIAAAAQPGSLASGAPSFKK